MIAIAKDRRTLSIMACLLIGTAILYAPVRHFDFIRLDDDLYVTKSPRVLQGISIANVGWAFTQFHGHFWQPLTTLSLMLDVSIFGPGPRGFHITNVILHAINALLLFLLLRQMTGATWRSAIVAALFAWHPLNIESVAWVTERKNCLSTLFWMLTVFAYVQYAATPRLRNYLLVTFLFVMGLMAKPMLVTLPLVLLFLDYWPLGRLDLGQHFPNGEPGRPSVPRVPWQRLVWEKAPLLALSAAFSGVAIIAQGWAVTSFELVPLWARLANTPLSYAAYLKKMFWPSKLAIYYPYRQVFSLPLVAATALFIIAATVVAVIVRKRRPYLLVGWLWFLVTLVPVIGLVQLGEFSMADRFAYVPLIGIFIALTWLMADGLRKTKHATTLGALLAVMLTMFFYGISVRQLRYWRDSFTLFNRTLFVTTNNALIHNNLSEALLDVPAGLALSESHAAEALRLRPNYLQAHINLGVGLLRDNKTADAIAHLERACEINPKSAEAQANLGTALMVGGNVDDALTHFYEALRLDPELVPVLKALAWTRATFRDSKYRNGSEALALAERAARLTNHTDPDVLGVLAAALAENGRFEEAIKAGELGRELALKNYQIQFAGELEQRIELFRLGLPYRLGR